MTKFRTFQPCTLLSPVPSVLVSCKGIKADANPNMLTVAWAGTVNSEPPMVSISVRKSRYSYDLIKESGEFVVNLVDAQHCRALDYCGVRSGKNGDKFAATGLHAMPAVGLTYAPAVEECPAYLACKVRQMIELGSHDLFLGEVVGVQVRDKLFDEDGSLHLERANLVCYTHGVYQKATDVLGFFGYSVARPEIFKKRMRIYHKG